MFLTKFATQIYLSSSESVVVLYSGTIVLKCSILQVAFHFTKWLFKIVSFVYANFVFTYFCETFVA